MGAIKNDIYLQARWFDKDRYNELLQHTGWGLQWRLGLTVLHHAVLYYFYSTWTDENDNVFFFKV